jgi:site-specific DNA recombinase
MGAKLAKLALPTVRYVASYCRVSTLEQTKGTSLADQRDANRRKAGGEAARIREYVESEGASGQDMNRSAFNRLRDDIEAGLIDRVIVAKVDRLGRNSIEQALFLHNLKKHRVGIEFSMQDIDASTSEGQLILGILGSVAQFEGALIGDRTKRGRHRRARDGFYPRRPPYGYTKLPDGHLAVNEAQAAIIREIFRRYHAGEKRLAICQDLTARGADSPAGLGWERSTMMQVLKRRAYMGEAELSRPHTIMVPVPIIIEPAVWAAVQERVTRNAKDNGGPRPTHPVTFRRLTFCACGAPMRPSMYPGRAGRFRCSSRTSGRGSCGMPDHMLEETENLVWAGLVNFYADPARLLGEYQKRQGHTHAAIIAAGKAAHAEIAKLSRKRDGILDNYEDGHYDKAERDSKLRAVTVKLAEARARAHEAEAAVATFDPEDVTKVMQAAARKLATMPVAERAAYAADAVKRITLHARHADLELWVPAGGAPTYGTNAASRPDTASRWSVQTLRSGLVGRSDTAPSVPVRIDLPAGPKGARRTVPTIRHRHDKVTRP